MFQSISLIILILVIINSVSANDNENFDFMVEEKTKIYAITEFCSLKPKKDFCSKESLKYMFQVLKMQHEKNMKQVEQNNKMKMEILSAKLRQLKLKKFFEKNPKYKIMAEIPRSRHF